MHANTNLIYVGKPVYDSLAAGQAVRYVARDGFALGGLTSGVTYYVIKTGTSGIIQLAVDYCHAVGTDGDSTRCPATPAPPAGPAGDIPIDVTAIDISVVRASGTDGTITAPVAPDTKSTFSAVSATFTQDDVGRLLSINSAIYQITKWTDSDTVTLDRNVAAAANATWSLYSDVDGHTLERSIAGLDDGRTYYVKTIDTPNKRIQLSATRGPGGAGAAITTFDDDDRPGPHGIGFVEVDLDLGAPVTANPANQTLNATGHGFLNDEQVYLLSPSVPGGLLLGKTYFVVESSANSFKLSRTKAGAPVDIAFAGTDVRVVRPAGLQSIFANLASPPTGTGQRLLAPSGASLTTITPTPGTEPRRRRPRAAAAASARSRSRKRRSPARRASRRRSRARSPPAPTSRSARSRRSTSSRPPTRGAAGSSTRQVSVVRRPL